MILVELNPNKDNKIIIKNISKVLSFGLVDDVPTCWALVEPKINSGNTCTLEIKKPNDEVDTELSQHFLVILTGTKGSFAIFERPSRIQQVKSMPTFLKA